MKKPSSSVLLFGGATLGVVALIVYAAMAKSGPSPYDGFAQCLTDKGVQMYGAWWCPHCQAQKALFENAFKHVTYIECSPNGSREMSEECKDAGVQSYPTWKFPDGTTLSGEQSFEQLAERSTCALPENP